MLSLIESNLLQLLLPKDDEFVNEEDMKNPPWLFIGREPRRDSVSSPSEGHSIESLARHSENFKFTLTCQ